jgi:UDP-glucuronate 4-epimerase
MTVLVTGGAGFIGSHFIERLLAASGIDARIICLDHFNSSYSPALKRANVARFAHDTRVTVVEQSFCDAVATRQLVDTQGVRQIVHLGAYAGVRASITDPLVYEENNVRGTLALLEAARESLVDRFVLVSSSTVYGLGAAVPFQEDAPLGIPLSPYGVTKRAAELLGLTYYQLHKIPVVCLRPFSVYGPRMRPDLAMRVFADAIVNRRAVPLFGDGSMRRDFTHVSDICAGLLAAMSVPAVLGQTINLGHHEPVSIRELLNLLEQELGAKAMIDERPAIAADMPLTCADLSKAERLLGYRPKISLAEGVRDFVTWFRQTAAR